MKPIRFTARERQVIRGMVQGLNPKEIAHRLGIAHKTVDVHRYHAMSKLRCHGQNTVVGLAIRYGIVGTEDLPFLPDGLVIHA